MLIYCSNEKTDFDVRNFLLKSTSILMLLDYMTLYYIKYI